MSLWRFLFLVYQDPFCPEVCGEANPLLDEGCDVRDSSPFEGANSYPEVFTLPPSAHVVN
jgi:hypothetical protein